MKSVIKDAFGEIKADENLKAKTEISVLKKIEGNRKVKKKAYLPRVALATLCLVFLLISIQWLYFTQTALISIDINPSLELGVNRFDRIISVKGLNEDGTKLVEKLNLYNKTTEEALKELVDNNMIVSLEKEGEELSITVSSKNEKQSQTILNQAESCTHGVENSSCHSITAHEAEEARKLGLPCGKYRAYLQLKTYEPSITPEEIASMTMREIRERINQYATPQAGENASVSTQETNCSNGNGQGEHHRYHHNMD